MTPLIVARGLSVAYGARSALSEVSVALEPGRTLALIGPNGAGKTTLLKALAGLLKPSSGSVAARAGLSLAYLAQSEPLPLDWRVRDLVALGRLPHARFWRRPSAEDEAALEDALRCTNTTAFAERKLSALSGGERQRVALARALAQRPDVLFLDEPTSHLDLRHQAELLASLRAQAERGVASVIVLHDLGLAAQVDRCLLLRGGELVAHGPPSAVLDAHVLSEAYGTALEVLQAPDGRRAVVARSIGNHP